MDAIELGKKIKAIRKTRGMTQEELGEKIGGLKRSTIANWEVGRRLPSLKDIEAMSKVLGVGIEYFSHESKRNVYDLIARARETFEDDNIEPREKAKAYREIMRMYLKISEED